MILLLNNMLNALTADPTLAGYSGGSVLVRRWERAVLPDFDDYCVVLSPEGESETLSGVLGVEKSFRVQIVCLVRNFGLPQALTGESPAGLIRFARDVIAVLRMNSLSGAVIPQSVVLDETLRFDVAPGERPHVLTISLEYEGRRRVAVS